MRSARLVALLGTALLLVGACGGDDEAGDGRAGQSSSTVPAETTTSAAPARFPGYESEVYADPEHWLCRPDLDDGCDADLDATVVNADGTTEIELWEPAADPPIDCFYVYPTISTDPTPNSDLVPGEDQELFVVRQQAARLGSQCRVFAPVYRQTTLTSLVARLGGATPPAGVDTGAIAYADVLDAWKHYLANDNDGRGVVLVGHSQGSGLLLELLQEQVDGDPVQRGLLVAALLLGAAVSVPDGADVGGDLQEIPLCGVDDQVGCVVSYASFRSTAPPPATSFFGRPREGGGQAACVNPAALAGGRAVLQPYLPTDGRSLPIGGVASPGGGAPAWVDPSVGGEEITTPFVSLPDFVEGECVVRDGFSYLEITVNGDPADPRIDDIGGDLTPEWGLHLVDANVAMGDLVDLVAAQAEAYVQG